MVSYFADLVKENLQRSLCGLRGVAGFQAGEDLHPSTAAVFYLQPIPGRDHRRLHEYRDTNLRRDGGVKAGEVLARDADNGHGVIVYKNHLRPGR